MRSISGSFAAAALLATVVQATPVMRMPTHMRVKRQDHAATQTGEMTFYNTGMTACGQVKSDGEKVAAVSKLYFDSYPGATANPNANPLCGQKATVTNPATGQSVVVEIWDRCDGCAFGDIDLTPGAFDLIASAGDGRIPGVTWQLGEGAPQPPPETQPPPPETTQPPPPPPETTPAPPETTMAPPPPETTMAPPPETTTAPPPPETTAPPVEEDPCPPEDPEDPPVTTPEDPCPPEDPEDPPVTTPEDPCPPEDPETPPTTPEDPCPPEDDGEGEGNDDTTTPPPDTNTGSAAAWDASKVYVGGDSACHAGTLYKAKWWTQGEQPPSQVWAEDGKC